MISFGSSTDILDCPIWLLCINVVAMEMLRTKLPPGEITISTQAVLVALRLMPTHTDMLGLESTVLATNEFCVIKFSEIQIRSGHFLLLSWEITQPNLNLGNSIVSWIHSMNLLRNFYKLAFSKLSQPAIWMCLHQGLVGYWVLAVSEP